MKRLKKDDIHLKLNWMLVSLQCQVVLCSRFYLKSFTCTTEERLDGTESVTSHDHDNARKIRPAEKEDIRTTEFEDSEEVLEDLRS